MDCLLFCSAPVRSLAATWSATTLTPRPLRTRRCSRPSTSHDSEAAPKGCLATPFCRERRGCSISAMTMTTPRPILPASANRSSNSSLLGPATLLGLRPPTRWLRTTPAARATSSSRRSPCPSVSTTNVEPANVAPCPCRRVDAEAARAAAVAADLAIGRTSASNLEKKRLKKQTK